MEFLFLMIDLPTVECWSQKQQRDASARMNAFQAELMQAGRYKDGGGIGSDIDAIDVLVLGDLLVEEHGAVANSAKLIGGFMIVECQSLAEAVQIAKDCPASEWASVKIRRLWR